MSFFTEVAFPFVIDTEKGFQKDPNDPGNWTGGDVGKGRLVGTKFGVSAASYPELDIENLTIETAQQIAKQDYWDLFQGDYLAFPLSLSMFDFGYNAGIHEAIVVLQRCLALPENGQIDPLTIQALTTRDPRALAQQYYVERMGAYQQMKNWVRYKNSWSDRAKRTRDKAITL